MRRRGAVPRTVRAATREQLDRLLVDRLVEIGESGDGGWADTAVLVDTEAELEHLRTVMMRAALPVMDVVGHAHGGRCLVLATYAAARGLEFERVLLPGIVESPERQPGEGGRGVPRADRAAAPAAVRRGHPRAHELWLGYLDEEAGGDRQAHRVGRASGVMRRRRAAEPGRGGGTDVPVIESIR